MAFRNSFPPSIHPIPIQCWSTPCTHPCTQRDSLHSHDPYSKTVTIHKNMKNSSKQAPEHFSLTTVKYKCRQNIVHQDGRKRVIEIRERDFLGLVSVFVSTVSDHMSRSKAVKKRQFFCFNENSNLFCSAPENSTAQKKSR